MRFYLALSLLLAVTAGLYWLSETRRLSARGQQLREQVDELRERLTESLGRGVELERAVAQMSGKLSESLEIQRAISATLTQKRQQLQDQRESLDSEMRVRRRVMPTGVRQALSDLNDCLRRDGYGGIRFHWASKIENGALLGAEFLEHRADTLRSILYACGRLTMELDREAGTLTLHMFAGSRSGETGPENFPEAGESLVLSEIDGPMWESRLPFLVTVTGEYDLVAEAKPRTRLDRVTLAAWMERVDHVLTLAGTELSYRLQRFRGLEDGHFTGVLLLAYDQGHQLALSAEADSMEVLVDRRAQSVSLVLRGGVLRKAGGDSDIPSSGYHILLPGVTVDATIEAMLGMVVYR